MIWWTPAATRTFIAPLIPPSGGSSRHPPDIVGMECHNWETPYSAATIFAICFCFQNKGSRAEKVEWGERNAFQLKVESCCACK